RTDRPAVQGGVRVVWLGVVVVRVVRRVGPLDARGAELLRGALGGGVIEVPSHRAGGGHAGDEERAGAHSRPPCPPPPGGAPGLHTSDTTPRSSARRRFTRGSRDLRVAALAGRARGHLL